MNTTSLMTSVVFVPVFILVAMPAPAFGGQAAAPVVTQPAGPAPAATTDSAPESIDPRCIAIPQLCHLKPNAPVETAPALAEPALLKIGGVKGESSDDGHKREIQALSFSWGMRQGKNIRKHLDRQSSDPEEGGEVARRASVSEIAVMKRMDKASAALAAPLPSGGATLVVARGALAKGQHIPVVVITMRSQTYELQNVEVTDCTAFADGTDSCSLNYQSLGQ